MDIVAIKQGQLVDKTIRSELQQEKEIEQAIRNNIIEYYQFFLF